jgi:limonene 1,2-monooxygenase
MTKRLGFGVFLAPHHPIGEHPTLQFQRDLELAQLLDELHYDEFWVGEHHSAGWETIASPEMFLVAAAERTKRIKLAPASSRSRTIIRSTSRSAS